MYQESAISAEKEDNQALAYLMQKGNLELKIALFLFLLFVFLLFDGFIESVLLFKAGDVVRQSLFKVNAVEAAALVLHGCLDALESEIDGALKS